MFYKRLRGKFVRGKLTTFKKRGVFSIAVSNTKENNTYTEIMNFSPNTVESNTNQVLAHGLLATIKKQAFHIKIRLHILTKGTGKSRECWISFEKQIVIFS